MSATSDEQKRCHLWASVGQFRNDDFVRRSGTSSPDDRRPSVREWIVACGGNYQATRSTSTATSAPTISDKVNTVASFIDPARLESFRWDFVPFQTETPNARHEHMSYPDSAVLSSDFPGIDASAVCRWLTPENGFHALHTLAFHSHFLMGRRIVIDPATAAMRLSMKRKQPTTTTTTTTTTATATALGAVDVNDRKASLPAAAAIAAAIAAATAVNTKNATLPAVTKHVGVSISSKTYTKRGAGSAPMEQSALYYNTQSLAWLRLYGSTTLRSLTIYNNPESSSVADVGALWMALSKCTALEKLKLIAVDRCNYIGSCVRELVHLTHFSLRDTSLSPSDEWMLWSNLCDLPYLQSLDLSVENGYLWPKLTHTDIDSDSEIDDRTTSDRHDESARGLSATDILDRSDAKVQSRFVRKWTKLLWKPTLWSLVYEQGALLLYPGFLVAFGETMALLTRTVARDGKPRAPLQRLLLGMMPVNVDTRPWLTSGLFQCHSSIEEMSLSFEKLKSTAASLLVTWLASAHSRRLVTFRLHDDEVSYSHERTRMPPFEKSPLYSVISACATHRHLQSLTIPFGRQHTVDEKSDRFPYVGVTKCISQSRSLQYLGLSVSFDQLYDHHRNLAKLWPGTQQRLSSLYEIAFVPLPGQNFSGLGYVQHLHDAVAHTGSHNIVHFLGGEMESSTCLVRNFCQTVRWRAIILWLAFCRSNKGHTYQLSIRPLLNRCVFDMLEGVPPFQPVTRSVAASSVLVPLPSSSDVAVQAVEYQIHGASDNIDTSWRDSFDRITMLPTEWTCPTKIHATISGWFKSFRWSDFLASRFAQSVLLTSYANVPAPTLVVVKKRPVPMSSTTTT